MCVDEVAPRLRRTRGALLVGMSLALGMLTLGGCTPRHNDRGDVGSQSINPSSSVTAPRTGRASAREPESSAVSSPRCTASHVTISARALQTRTAVGSLVIEFRSSAATSCWLVGYPRVTAVRGPAHEWVPIRTRSAGYPPDEVVVTRRSPASALIEPADGSGRCHRTGSWPLRLTVTTPDGSRKQYNLPAVPSCGPMIVNPIVPGTDGLMVG